MLHESSQTNVDVKITPMMGGAEHGVIVSADQSWGSGVEQWSTGVTWSLGQWQGQEATNNTSALIYEHEKGCQVNKEALKFPHVTKNQPTRTMDTWEIHQLLDNVEVDYAYVH